VVTPRLNPDPAKTAESGTRKFKGGHLLVWKPGPLAAGAEESGAPGEIRTPDPLVRSQMLYPAELRARAAILPKFAGGAAECVACSPGCGTSDWPQNEAQETMRRAESALAAEMYDEEPLGKSGENWWAWVDLNYRPHPYQGCALAT
jgi:hypothetical protein